MKLYGLLFFVLALTLMGCKQDDPMYQTVHLLLPMC